MSKPLQPPAQWALFLQPWGRTCKQHHRRERKTLIYFCYLFFWSHVLYIYFMVAYKVQLTELSYAQSCCCVCWQIRLERSAGWEWYPWWHQCPCGSGDGMSLGVDTAFPNAWTLIHTIPCSYFRKTTSCTADGSPLTLAIEITVSQRSSNWLEQII